MAMKKTLTTIEGLAPDVAKLYVKSGDVFVLDIEGEEDVGGLKRALERERENAKNAKAELTTLSTRLAAIEDEANKAKAKAGDVTALEESWKRKLADTETALKAELATRDNYIRDQLVTNVAAGIAKDISTAPDLLLPHILKRLAVEVVDGKPVTRVLDKDGKPSAASIQELSKEFVANPSFAAVITASKAAGGGAAGGGSGGGATLDAFKDSAGNIQWGQVAAAAKENPAIMKLVTPAA